MNLQIQPRVPEHYQTSPLSEEQLLNGRPLSSCCDEDFIQNLKWPSALCQNNHWCCPEEDNHISQWCFKMWVVFVHTCVHWNKGKTFQKNFIKHHNIEISVLKWRAERFLQRWLLGILLEKQCSARFGEDFLCQNQVLLRFSFLAKQHYKQNLINNILTKPIFHMLQPLEETGSCLNHYIWTRWWTINSNSSS